MMFTMPPPDYVIFTPMLTPRRHARFRRLIFAITQRSMPTRWRYESPRHAEPLVSIGESERLQAALRQHLRLFITLRHRCYACMPHAFDFDERREGYAMRRAASAMRQKIAHAALILLDAGAHSCLRCLPSFSSLTPACRRFCRLPMLLPAPRSSSPPVCEIRFYALRLLRLVFIMPLLRAALPADRLPATRLQPPLF